MPAPRPRAPMLAVGTFFGVLAGVFFTLLFATPDSTEPIEEYRRRLGGSAHAGAPPPGGSGDPHTNAPPHGGGAAPEDRARASFAKVHFMKKFLAALSSTPGNAHPAAGWKPLLKDGEALRCSDCHDSGSIDIERMRERDPGREATERYRKNPAFMIPLMEKWVERLNRLHADKLVKPVTCTDCHRMDPREKFEVYPPLMANFVKALKEPPANRNPAKRWKPLLKDPSTQRMFCAACHGQIGEAMERSLAQLTANPAPAKYRNDKEFMIEVMDDWVERLNRELGDFLVKPVVCLDCHETDPRR